MALSSLYRQSEQSATLPMGIEARLIRSWLGSVDTGNGFDIPMLEWSPWQD
jgi:hypothetical protein